MNTAAKRHIWCETSQARLFGRAYRRELETPNWWQRLIGQRYEPGTFFEMAAVTCDEALTALDQFLADPVAFAIESFEGCHINMVYQQGQRQAFLDTWFSDAAIEDSVIRVEDIRPLVELIFTSESDSDIAVYLHRHTTNA